MLCNILKLAYLCMHSDNQPVFLLPHNDIQRQFPHSVLDGMTRRLYSQHTCNLIAYTTALLPRLRLHEGIFLFVHSN